VARRRGRERVRTVYRRARGAISRRRPRRSDTKRLIKKAVIGGGVGMVVSAGLTYLGRTMNQPLLMEVGQRGGSIVSTMLGGVPGNAAYQAFDAVFDRVVSVGGVGRISGQPSQVYL